MDLPTVSGVKNQPFSVLPPTTEALSAVEMVAPKWESATPLSQETQETVFSTNELIVESNWGIKPPRNQKDLSLLRTELQKASATLRELESVPPFQRSKADELKMDILRNEIAIMQAYNERYECAERIESAEGEMMELDSRLVDLLKKTAPANDVGLHVLDSPERLAALIAGLPAAEKIQAQEIRHEQEELQFSISSDRSLFTKLTATLVGLDRLLLQKREQAKELNKETAAATQEANDVATSAAEAKKKASIGKGAVGGGLAVAAMGFFGIARFAGWIDQKLESLFHGDSADKLASFWNMITFGGPKKGGKEDKEG
jgi:hypothetical protein